MPHAWARHATAPILACHYQSCSITLSHISGTTVGVREHRSPKSRDAKPCAPLGGIERVSGSKATPRFRHVFPTLLPA